MLLIEKVITNLWQSGTIHDRQSSTIAASVKRNDLQRALTVNQRKDGLLW
jgi:hypothetical protein